MNYTKMIKEVEARERAKKEAARKIAEDKAREAREAKEAAEAARKHAIERHGAIVLAIKERREEDAIDLIRANDTTTDIVSTTDATGSTVLHQAAACDLSECCEAILAYLGPEFANVKDTRGNTALHICARNNSSDSCEVLLEANCDVRAKDERGWMAVDYAQTWGLAEVATVLTRNDEAEEARPETPPSPTSTDGSDDRSAFALHDALENGNNEYALHLASDETWLCVNNTDKKSRTALHIAGSKGIPEVCTALLNRKDFRLPVASAFDRDRATALHHAVGNRRTDAALAILASDRFTGVGALDINGHTALHLAAQRGDAAVCEAFMGRAKPKDLKVRDKHGRTALDYAEENLENLEHVAAALRTKMESA